MIQVSFKMLNSALRLSALLVKEIRLLCSLLFFVTAHDTVWKVLRLLVFTRKVTLFEKLQAAKMVYHNQSHNVRMTFPCFEQLTGNRPNRLTQCCTQFKSPGVKVLCVLHLH